MTTPSVAVQGARPWAGLDETVGAVLLMLAEHVGMDRWMLTQLDGADQKVVATYPEGAVRPGMSLPWTATFCRRMIAGEAPQVASVVSAVPAYAELRAELTRLSAGLFGVPGAYVGVPIRLRDETLYGTLCGFARRAQPLSLHRHLRLVQFAGQVLATALEAGLARGVLDADLARGVEPPVSH